MKKFILILSTLFCLILSGCQRSINGIIGREPSLTGIVQEYHENQYITIETDEMGMVVVPLDVEISDSMTHFSIGDEVTVYYDGNCRETYPVELTKVYAILLITPAR